jgi:hypothetical protein
VLNAGRRSLEACHQRVSDFARRGHSTVEAMAPDSDIRSNPHWTPELPEYELAEGFQQACHPGAGLLQASGSRQRETRRWPQLLCSKYVKVIKRVMSWRDR